MTSEPTSDRQIATDIERLRAQFPDTQELYREVCVLLFFRFGITPTANKLYQLVRKGSMSAPAEALERFWENLREKSRVRIEHPDLPDALKTAAADLVSTLWAQAQASAHAGFAAFRAEAQSAVVEAENAKSTADSHRTAAQMELIEAHQSSQMAQDRTLELERHLASERGSKESLSAQLDLAGRQQVVLESALAEARHEFTGELEKMRQALQLSEERHEASDKRSLLEIDRERSTATKLQKELQVLRQATLDTSEKHRIEITLFQNELGMMRQNIGVAEGTLQEMRSMYQNQAVQLESMRSVIAERDTQYALLQREMGLCHVENTVMKDELAQLLTKKTGKTATNTVKPKRTQKNP